MPSLEPQTWQSDGTIPPIDTIVGIDFEQHLIYALDRKKNVFALDLDSRRTRSLLPQTVRAILGPDASLYAVDTALAIVQISRRSVTRFPGRLRALPTQLFATAGGEVLAVEPTIGRLASISADAARSVALPRGPLAASFWGDLIAVATDTGIVLADPQAKRAPAVIREPGARALLFSPSGHRLYAVSGAHELLVIDRFGRTIMKRIPLPAAAAVMRTDFFGNWLLVRAADGSTVWVVDLDRESVLATVTSDWAADLPAISSPHTLLLRRGPDVVALDLSSAALGESGRVAAGAADLWLPVVWAPPPARVLETAEATSDTARVAPPVRIIRADSGRPASPDTSQPVVPAAGTLLYLQVSSTRNPTWADDLAGKLRGAGLQPTILKPAEAEESYRVVLGPFKTREEAEATGRRLGMPSFVITAQGDSGR